MIKALKRVICSNCLGSGRIANDEDKSPWSRWADLHFGEDAAIQVGLIRPELCPVCSGVGRLYIQIHDEGSAP